MSEPAPPTDAESIGALLWRFRRPEYWLTWLGVSCLHLAARLPLPVVYALSCTLGEVLFWSFARRRRIALRNLSACFPGNGARWTKRTAHRHFHFLVYGFLTVGVAWWGSARRIRRATTVVNGNILRQHMDQGRNIILLAPHFIGLEFGGRFLSSVGPLATVYKKAGNVLLEALIRKYRIRQGVVLYDHHQKLKGLIRLIRSGHSCYYLPDQNIGRKGVFAEFFNIPAATNSYLGRLAKMADASVLPVCTRALPWGRGFEVIFFPSLDEQLTGEPAADARCLNQTIEKLVQCAPEQYFWSHRRFKTRPPGEPPFYD